MSSMETTCKKEACAIQACLAANQYQQTACLSEIRALVRCCEKASAAGGATAAPPPSCGGFSRALLEELEGKGRRR